MRLSTRDALQDIKFKLGNQTVKLLAHHEMLEDVHVLMTEDYVDHGEHGKVASIRLTVYQEDAQIMQAILRTVTTKRGDNGHSTS